MATRPRPSAPDFLRRAGRGGVQYGVANTLFQGVVETFAWHPGPSQTKIFLGVLTVAVTAAMNWAEDRGIIPSLFYPTNSPAGDDSGLINDVPAATILPVTIENPVDLSDGQEVNHAASSGGGDPP